MKAGCSLLLLLATTLAGHTALAQTNVSTSPLDEPNPADFELAVEDAPPLFAQGPASSPQPEPPSTQRETYGGDSDGDFEAYRAKMEQFGKQRHTFVRCDLRNGKVVTGLPRNVAQKGFEIKTGALSGTFVAYTDLAKPPRQVAAVGTRIKHGAEWTGLGMLVVVAVPVVIVLSPLLFASGWRC